MLFKQFSYTLGIFLFLFSSKFHADEISNLTDVCAVVYKTQILGFYETGKLEGLKFDIVAEELEAYGYKKEWVEKNIRQIKKTGVLILDLADPRVDDALKVAKIDSDTLNFLKENPESVGGFLLSPVYGDSFTPTIVINFLNASKRSEHVTHALGTLVHEGLHLRFKRLSKRYIENPDSPFFQQRDSDATSAHTLIEEFLIYEMQYPKHSPNRRPVIEELFIQNGSLYKEDWEMGARKFLAIIFQTMKKSGHTFKSFSHLDLIKNTARITKAELDLVLQDSAFVEFYNTFHP